MTTKTKGPTTTVKHSCINCKYCRSEKYLYRSDWGYYTYCNVLSKEEKFIGHGFTTPKWCPFLKSKEKTE